QRAEELQRTAVDGGEVRVGLSAGQRQRAGTVFDQHTRTADRRGAGDRAGVVEDEHVVVRDVAADIAVGGNAVAQLQRAFVDRHAAAERVHRVDEQRTRADFEERARAGNHAGAAEGIV